jgi:hypothetical protein
LKQEELALLVPLQAADLDAPQRDVVVTVLRAGMSRNGRYFTPQALQDVAEQLDGLKAFADHPAPSAASIHQPRSVRDVVGFYREPRLEGDRVRATLHIFASADWLWCLVQEAAALGRPDVLGLSIDSLASVRTQQQNGKSTQVVERIPMLRSCDVVTRAAAGGAFERVLADESNTLSEMEKPLQEQHNNHANNGPQAGAETIHSLHTEEVRMEETTAMTADTRLAEAEAKLACMTTLHERLDAATLPAPIKRKLRRRFEGETFTSAVLEQAIQDEVETVRELTGSQSGVHGMGVEKSRVSMGATGSSRGLAAAEAGLARLLGVREIAADGPVPNWSSIREAYVQITGDTEIRGALHPELSVVREANEVTTSVINHALANAISKRLVQDYSAQPQDWKKLCAIRSIRDYKPQYRVLLHDFGTLGTVNENAAYTNLAWDDTRETYTPAKRGNLVVVTREAILNDDLEAIRRIPAKLAIAAATTINEFVYGLFTGNPALGDNSKVFDDGTQNTHKNRGTTALAASALQAAITQMMKQTNSAGKRLGIKPRYLLLPPDLYWTAVTILNSTLLPGSQNNDANPLQGMLEPIVVPQFTDAKDYYLMADPAQIECLEVGFINGQETPELLVQDNPTTGSVFTNDAISYKVRWEFGGGWLDYRGAYWAEVA